MLDFIIEHVIIMHYIIMFFILLNHCLIQVLLKLLKPLPLVACVHKNDANTSESLSPYLLT